MPSLHTSKCRENRVQFGYQILGWLYELTTVILEARKWHARSSSKSYILNKYEISIALPHCRILTMPSTPEQPTACGNYHYREQGIQMCQCDLQLGIVYLERFIFRSFYQGTLWYFKMVFLPSQYTKEDLKYPDTLKLRKYISPNEHYL